MVDPDDGLLDIENGTITALPTSMNIAGIDAELQIVVTGGIPDFTVVGKELFNRSGF